MERKEHIKETTVGRNDGKAGKYKEQIKKKQSYL